MESNAPNFTEDTRFIMDCAGLIWQERMDDAVGWRFFVSKSVFIHARRWRNEREYASVVLLLESWLKGENVFLTY